jgi:hypothetical protein
MEAINDSLKNVACCAAVIQSYLELNDIQNKSLLYSALDLLEKITEELSKAV